VWSPGTSTPRRPDLYQNNYGVRTESGIRRTADDEKNDSRHDHLTELTL